MSTVFQDAALFHETLRDNIRLGQSGVSDGALQSAFSATRRSCCLTNPPALDTKSETIVQTALDRLAKGHTTSVIARHPSTIQDTQKTVVKDQGGVADLGKQMGLFARGGRYADFCRLQFRDDK